MELASQEFFPSDQNDRSTVLLCLIGYGLFLAWIWICYSTSIVFPLVSDTSTTLTASQLIANFVEILVLVALVFLHNRPIKAVIKRKLVIERLGGAFGFLGVGLLLLSTYLGESAVFALAAIGWAFCGTSAALCAYTWIRIFCRIDLSNLCLCISAAIVLGTAITYILCYLPITVSRIAAAVLPASSLYLFTVAKSGLPSSGQESAADSPSPERARITSSMTRILVAIFFYTLVFAALINPLTTRNGIGVESDGGFMLAASFIAGATIIAATRMASCTERLRKLYLVVLPLMVITLVVFPFVQNVSLNAAGFLGAFSFKLFDVICWILVYDTALRNRIVAPKALLFSRICYACGMFFGTACGFYLSINNLFKDKDLFTTLCLGGVVVLVIITTIVLRESGIFPSDGDRSAEGSSQASDKAVAPLSMPGPEDIFQYKAGRIAQRYNLTKREFDVFLLLSKGRSNKLIEERLVISSHTVDSHITHIYRKCDVHSRQEVMDLIENEHVDMEALAKDLQARRADESAPESS